jgi:glucose/arabinose dehydrogenase
MNRPLCAAVLALALVAAGPVAAPPPGAAGLSVAGQRVAVAATPAPSGAADTSVVMGARAAGFHETIVTTGLDSPVSMAMAPDGRAFVCEQGGRVRVIRDGRLLARPFVTVPTRGDIEEGLLGVTFDPGFANNRLVYVLYTALTPRRHNRVVRYQAAGDTVVPGSERAIFELDENTAHLHVGGALHFGRDGMLYIGTGDNEDDARAQSLRTTFGKLLRIRPDGGIPRDNPFVSVAEGKYRAIFARGLRNVFSLDVDPRDGKMFLNDVGGSEFEEVDLAIAGGNYGWPLYEGPGEHQGFRFPVHAYPHSLGCAITGGAFYAPQHPAYPAEWVGRYFYAEFCGSELRWLDPRSPARAHRFLKTRVPGPVDVRVGPDGTLWYLARGNVVPEGGGHVPGGVLLRIAYERGR